MTDTVCRVAVHAPARQTTVDVVLPAGCPVGVLLPSIVDLVLGDADPTAEPVRWFLARPGGAAFDPSVTLRDNGVREGDLLVLAAAPTPAPRVVPADPAGAVTAAVRHPAPRETGPAAVVGFAVILALAAALTWAGSVGGQQIALWVAAALAAASAVAAAGGRVPEPLCTVLAVGAVVEVAVTGVLATAAVAPGVLLGSGAALMMAMMLCRFDVGGMTALSGCAATAGAAAVATGCGMLAARGVAATGALLTVVSLLLLSVAPTLTVAIAGLSPTRATIGERRAQTAQRMLTGLVGGWAATAAAGAVLVAADARVPRLLAALFSVVVAALMLLRHRVHADPLRRTALATTGFVALMTALWTVVTVDPRWAPWWCAGIAAAGAAALPVWLRGPAPNPLSRWLVQLTEYASLAAVVPLAAWVAGVYDTVRGMNLP